MRRLLLSSSRTAPVPSCLQGGQQLSQVRHLGLRPEAKRYQEDKAAYEDAVKDVRKQYIENVRARAEAEQAKKRAETEKIREQKRQRLVLKYKEQQAAKARHEARQAAQRELFRQHLAKVQAYREQHEAAHREKQKNLVATLAQESSTWITRENLDQKITEVLFSRAGSTTGAPTRRSRNWQYMAVANLPDLSGIEEEELFDDKEDIHFLTEKSPWNHEIVIPEGHELYEAGTVKPGELREDDGEPPKDSNLYFEDAIWRPSFIADVYSEKVEDFQRLEASVDELGQLRDIAEKYEEHLFASMVDDPGNNIKGYKVEEEEGFNPEVFEEDEEEEATVEGEKDDSKK